MHRLRSSLLIGTLALAALASSAFAAIPAKKAPLMTEYADKVDRDHPWPEYPRPQLARTDWQSLNGTWEYQPGNEGDAAPVGKTLALQILVPFPVESALSGVMEHHDRLWYRRTFTVPAAWKGKDVLLNFGAVDFESEVFVNGKSIGIHKGGYLPFSYDITPALHGDGPQEVIVRVFDPTNAAGMPRGKQSLYPRGIMYTPTTGIWQTVWIEPVAPAHVNNLKIVPDIDAGNVKITVNAQAAGDATVNIKVTDGAAAIASIDGKANTELTIPIRSAKLWSPDSPHLYNLDVTLGKGGASDHVKSYFGMRKISLGDVDGVKRILLNNKFVFQIGPLDQGFWPDGLYTPPTDEAIKTEIQRMKEFGFNMVRKRIKVEPARWYYYTDTMGLLVWQDMPSANSYMAREEKHPPVDKEECKSELEQMVNALISVPSIVQWEPFNEGQGQGQQNTKELVEMVKKLDPSRLVDEASGGQHTGAGDIFDEHPYPAPRKPNPQNPRDTGKALVIGEYGGIGLDIQGHLWKPGRTYTQTQSGKELEQLYGDFTNLLKKFRDEDGLSAAVYTQITDVESELNGLLTYDRLFKCDPKQIARANHFQYPEAVYDIIVPTSEKEPQTWKYSTVTKKDWMKPQFDDKDWKSGPGGFGVKGQRGAGTVGTLWKSANNTDIYLRRTVKLPNLTPEQIAQLLVRTRHDDGIDVYINGVQVFTAKGPVGDFVYRPLTKEAKDAIKPNAENLIAVHCHQVDKDQFVDVGLSIREAAK